MLKKLYQKIKQIVVEWQQQIMVDKVVVEVCVDHHQEWVVVAVVAVVDGALWEVNQTSVDKVVVTDLVEVVMEQVEIMVIVLHLMVVVMVVIWGVIVAAVE